MRDRTEFGQRLRKARLHSKLTQEQVAEAIGITQGTYSDLERVNNGSSYTVQFAKLFRCSAEWLATGDGEPGFDPVHPSTTGGKISRSNAGAAASLAHELSVHPFQTPPTLSWEDLMSNELALPLTFVLAVPDDALMPATPQGTELIFSTSATPRFGKGVLVRARDGQVYLRRYAQAPGGSWQAVATNPAYATLEPERDGLKVLAVAMWRAGGDV